jgi:CheY-like chemotaxis protein
MIVAGQILFADDESTFLHFTAELIGKKGYEVNCVESADAREAAVRMIFLFPSKKCYG